MSTTTTTNPNPTLPQPNTALPPDADTLPIIDIAPYLPGQNDPNARAATAAALHAACRDFGFFYLDI
ncbi:hypothetical protein FRC08_009683, partial [Ceratobasidium sp. 394]